MTIPKNDICLYAFNFNLKCENFSCPPSLSPRSRVTVTLYLLQETHKSKLKKNCRGKYGKVPRLTKGSLFQTSPEEVQKPCVQRWRWSSSLEHEETWKEGRKVWSRFFRTLHHLRHRWQMCEIKKHGRSNFKKSLQHWPYQAVQKKPPCKCQWLWKIPNSQSDSEQQHRPEDAPMPSYC